MNSYLWINGAIQPDTTQPRGRARRYLLVLFTAVLVVALTAAIVRARAMLASSLASHAVAQIER